MTLPAAWKCRRFRTPPGLLLYYSDISEQEYVWSGSVPVTTPARTLRDCAGVAVSPELLRQAVDEGLARGLFARRDISDVEKYLASFEGAT